MGEEAKSARAGILPSPSPVQFHICVSAHVSILYLQQDGGNICNALYFISSQFHQTTYPLSSEAGNLSNTLYVGDIV